MVGKTHKFINNLHISFDADGSVGGVVDAKVCSLSDEVDLDTTCLRLDVVISVIDLNFLVAGQVKIGGRGPESRIIRDIRTVDTPGVVILIRAMAVIARLLPGFVSSNI